MNKILSRMIKIGLGAALLAVICAFPVRDAKAAQLDGRLRLLFDPSSGELEADYTGLSDLSKNTTYTFYKGGNECQSGKDTTFVPTDKGKYTVVMEDPGYSDSLESNTVVLYEVTSNTDLTYNSPNALYKAGNSVRATKVLGSKQQIGDWTANVTGLDLTVRSNYVTFTMPSADVVLTCDVSDTYQVKIYGGTADVTRAAAGDVFTIRASSISGKSFLGWKVTGGGTFDSAIASVTQFKMPANDVSIVGTFVENSVLDEATRSRSSSNRNNSSSMRNWGNSSSMYGYGNGSSSMYGSYGNNSNNIRIADPLHAVYEVLWSNNYKVDMFHARQGLLCDLQFKSALNGDTLCLDYFNLVINNNYNIRETPTPITLRLTIPMDLQWPGRNWRMICVGRFGEVFSFPDEDTDDETITFSPDRFYAFAMAYNDNPPEPEVVEEEVTEEEGYMEFSDEEIAEITEEPSEEAAGGISEAHSTNSLPAISSADEEPEAQSAEHYNGLPQGGNNSQASEISTPVNISSDKTAAISNSRGMKVSEINL